MSSKHSGALFLALPVLLAAAGCASRPTLVVDVEVEERAPLRLGVPGACAGERLAVDYQPLTTYLARGLGRPIELVGSQSYRSFIPLFEQRRIDLAWLSGPAFDQAALSRRATPLARMVRDGMTTYRGLIVARADSPVRTAGDLAGRSLAYVDPHSGSGYLAANEVLSLAGVTPGADLGRTEMTYSHLESLRAVRSGRFDAAAVFAGALHAAGEGFAATDFRVIATSAPMDNDVVVAVRELPRDLKLKLTQLLIGMSKDPAGQRALAAFTVFGRVDGFVEAR